MGLYTLLRPLLFRLDPELAHDVALALIGRGVFETGAAPVEGLEQTFAGIRFSNPLGLAAGVDKNGAAIEQWENLGFGFAEIGTATRLPQPGNPKPRLFRLPAEQALVNSLGFNNHGARALAGRLGAARPSIPIGVNIGKSRSVPLERAISDIAACFKLLAPQADYVAVNVSSPNTPGVRDLQEKGRLSDLMRAMKEIDSRKPIFVKVSPDLEVAALDDVVEVAHECGLSGIIATNTTVRRDVLRVDPQIEGGLSGRPLSKLSDDALAYLARSCDPKLTLIGVGGIFNGEDLFRKIALGAHLCEVYTGFVYGGPSMPRDALRRLRTLMDERGFPDLASLRGSAL
jgi:dihydroorotate dehydrogenase